MQHTDNHLHDCYFCDQRCSNRESYIDIQLYRVIRSDNHVHDGLLQTTTKYEKLTHNIPRCNDCRKKLDMAILFPTSLPAGIFAVLAFYWLDKPNAPHFIQAIILSAFLFAASTVVFFLIASFYVHESGIAGRSLSKRWNTQPELLDILEQGWHIGDSPS